MLEKHKDIIGGAFIIAIIAIVTYDLDITTYIVLASIITLVLLELEKTRQVGQVLAFVGATFLAGHILNIAYLEMLIGVVIILIVNKLIQDSLLKQQQDEFVKTKLNIAKRNIIDSSDYIIVFVDEDLSVLWANEKAYNEFPSLLQTQSFEQFSGMKEGEPFLYNNNVYQVHIDDGAYYLKNITKTYRESKTMISRQIVMGYLQIDNYDYFKSQMDAVDFFEMVKTIKSHIVNWCDDNSIYYQEIEEDRMQLLLPLDYIQGQEENKYNDISKIVKEIRESDYEITLSLGIAYEFDSVLSIGNKAKEAIELAISRGGAQIVVFQGAKKRYYGGRVNALKNSSKIRARFVFNTISSIIEEKEVIYLLTHRNPDYDSIGSILLMKKLIEEQLDVSDKEFRVVLDRNINPEYLEMIRPILGDQLMTDAVVDQTKNNLLLVLDTNSKDIISHLKLYEEINECIVVDHHQAPEHYLDVSLFSWIEPNASSTTELVCEMFGATNTVLKDRKIAKLGLLGILTDTNSFRFRADQYALSATSFLVGAGVTINEAMDELQLTVEDYDLKRRILSNTLFVKKFAICEVDYNVDDVLLSIVGNELVDIKDVDCAIVIAKSKIEGKYIVKLRSTPRINSKRIIEDFGGGGHARQAAGVLDSTAREGLLQAINKWEE
ncbi:DHH family phosphoesterase [Mollicutes bacterium LVI A0078]|nr:DHH family phosphoesterase [Mollicutes bacterium LVI A0075]WOO90582.1 DHH family phosphoesterase [Mollicutes bacterium LVI A0078]